MRIYMQSPPADDQPPRFYQLFLQRDLLGGWTLVRQWGVQGAGGRLQRDTYADWDSALEALMQARDRQLSRGYRVVFAESPQRSG